MHLSLVRCLFESTNDNGVDREFLFWGKICTREDKLLRRFIGDCYHDIVSLFIVLVYDDFSFAGSVLWGNTVDGIDMLAALLLLLYRYSGKFNEEGSFIGVYATKNHNHNLSPEIKMKRFWQGFSFNFLVFIVCVCVWMSVCASVWVCLCMCVSDRWVSCLDVISSHYIYIFIHMYHVLI